MCLFVVFTRNSTLEEIAVDIGWRVGDVMMIDNLQALHGRRPFTPAGAAWQASVKSVYVRGRGRVTTSYK